MSNQLVASDDWVLITQTPNGVASHLQDRQKETKTKITGIFADLVIPGRGKPLEKQAVISENGKIVYVGTCKSAPPRYSEIEWQHVPVLMPGMWECHAHFFGTSPKRPIDMENMAMGNPVEAGARNVRALKDTLYAGFTSCVDLGGYAPELQKVMDEGLVLGPTLYGAGAALSQTAGHGDVFEISYGSVRQRLSLNAPGADLGIVGVLQVDGIEECRKAVRVNLRRGAKVIKVFTSGGVTSRDDDPMLQQFSDEELRTIVDEAKRMGLVCAAHAVGKAGILAAVRAGFKVIEHNSYADSEVLQAIKKNDRMVVATITPLRSILDNEDKYPPSMVEKVKVIAETHLNSYKDAIKAGVKCALGSDLFGGIGTVLSPGLNGKEVGYAVDAGMTPLQAIEAATANGPETLGPQAPLSGQIRVGYDADFIALDQNPLEDIQALVSPKNIKYIWKRGALVKAPGLDPWEALEG